MAAISAKAEEMVAYITTEDKALRSAENLTDVVWFMTRQAWEQWAEGQRS